MRIFYNSDQAQHRTAQYMRFGRVADPKDLPERTEALLAGVYKAGFQAESARIADIAMLETIHTAAYLEFLKTAWQEWGKLPDERGPEVWPSTFPYWSGRPEQASRPDCRPTAFIGKLGWYLGDMSVPITEHTWHSIIASAGSAIAGADAVIDEGNAYALCRPSSHHARSDRASGFCYINNAAVAAEHLKKKYSKVAILDIDAHHGDGTQQIFYHRDDILTVSVHADPAGYYPFYTGYSDETGIDQGKGFNLNLPLSHGSAIDAFLARLDDAQKKIEEFGTEALVISLGFDTHEDDPIGVLRLKDDDYFKVAQRCADLKLPTLVIQEGGYAIHRLENSIHSFLTGFTSSAV